MHSSSIVPGWRRSITTVQPPFKYLAWKKDLNAPRDSSSPLHHITNAMRRSGADA